MRVFSLGGRRDDRLQIHVNYLHHPVTASKDHQMRPWLLIDRPVTKKYIKDKKIWILGPSGLFIVNPIYYQNYLDSTY